MYDTATIAAFSDEDTVEQHAPYEMRDESSRPNLTADDGSLAMPWLDRYCVARFEIREMLSIWQHRDTLLRSPRYFAVVRESVLEAVYCRGEACSPCSPL